MKAIRLGRWLLFVLMILAFALLLRLLGWLPAALESGGLRRYSSLEQLQQELPGVNLFLPRYFPIRLEWPPAEVLAQSRPYFLVLLHVRDQATGRIGLAIRQVEASAAAPPEPRLHPDQVHRDEEITLRGRPALLRLASCQDGSPCNQLTWREGEFQLTVVVGESQGELLRIAASMLP